MTGRGRTEPLETFVKVPTFVHEALAEGRLSPTALALYVVLRSHRNNRNGAAWPSLPTLAKAMNMKNSKNLIKYTKELRAIGAIVAVENPRVLAVTYMFPESQTGTSGDTGWAVDNGFLEQTGTSGSTGPVPEEVPASIWGDTATGTSGSTQTRLTEPDRGIRKNERLVDTSRSPLRSADAERQPIQPPLMNSVKPPRIPEASVVEDQLRKLDQLLGRSAPYTGLFGRGPSDTEAARVLLYQGESLEVVASIIRDSKKKVS